MAGAQDRNQSDGGPSRPGRRRTLAILGGAAVILAAGSGAWVATRTPSGALRPWDPEAAASRDPRVRALAEAILAPNPHNQQPWLVDLREAGAAMLFVDLERLLPQTDPFGRQIVIGLGCFLETLRLAAADAGLRAEIQPFPDGADPARLDARPVARILFAPGGAPDPLATQIRRRRTNRAPFDPTRRPPERDLAAVIAAIETPGVRAGFTLERRAVAEISDLCRRAWDIESTTKRTHQESVDLMRIGRAEIEANPDGIALGGAMLEALNLIGVVTRETLADPTSGAFAEGRRRSAALLESAAGHLWMVSEANDRGAQLAAGRAWMRASLKATELGIALQPFSQALQEYPEMAELYDAARTRFDAPEGGAVQMLARFGYGPEIPPHPRWPLEAKLIADARSERSKSSGGA